MATSLLADGRAADVADMVEPLLDPVTAPAANTGQILLRGLMARVEVAHRDRLEPVFELLPSVADVSDVCTCVRAEVALWRGWAHGRRLATATETTRALRLLKESQELFASICDPMGRCWALLGQAHAYDALEEYGLLRHVLDEAASLLDRLHDTQAERWVHQLSLSACRHEAQYEAAEQHLEALRTIATEWGDRRVRGHAAAHAAALHADRGAAPDSIIEQAETAISLLRQRSGATASVLQATDAHVRTLCREGLPADAHAVIAEIENTLPEDASAATALQMLRAHVAIRCGASATALTILDNAFGRTLSPHPGLQRSSVALLYGEVLADQDHGAEAETWLRRAERMARESGDRRTLQRVLRTRPQAADGEHASSATDAPEPVDPTAAVKGFVAESREMQSVADTLRQIQPSHSSVLITGEGGAGKRLVARTVHRTGARADGPLVTVSCAPTQTGEPLEARLFGTVEADGTLQRGAVHAAEGGTLVLEDVDALPRPLQSSLLQFLTTGSAPSPGPKDAKSVDLRLVATTTADLDARVAEGRFDDALRDHLRVLSLHVPPLRERRADIPLLTRHFLDQLRPAGSSLVSITQPAMEALLRYNWPGNVRQLRNEVERALVHVQSEPAPTIDLDILLDTIVEGAKKTRSPQRPQEDPDAILEPDQTLSDVLSRTEKAVIERVLRACDGQITASADVLGLTRQGLYKKMKRLDIDASTFHPSAEPTPTN